MAQDRKVFVGGVPQDLNQDDLYAIFSSYAAVKKAWLQNCRVTDEHSCPPHNHRGFGFVIFYDASAIEELLGSNPSRFVVLRSGAKLEVKRALSSNKMNGSTHQNHTEERVTHLSHHENLISNYRPEKLIDRKIMDFICSVHREAELDDPLQWRRSGLSMDAWRRTTAPAPKYVAHRQRDRYSDATFGVDRPGDLTYPGPLGESDWFTGERKFRRDENKYSLNGRQSQAMLLREDRFGPRGDTPCKAGVSYVKPPSTTPRMNKSLSMGLSPPVSPGLAAWWETPTGRRSELGGLDEFGADPDTYDIFGGGPEEMVPRSSATTGREIASRRKKSDGPFLLEDILCRSAIAQRRDWLRTVLW